MGLLDGKVAIITGAAKGMGASHVRRFVDEGAKVIFTDILENEGQALAHELGNSVRFIKHDVTNEDDWKDVVQASIEAFGNINILVNNAGIDVPGVNLEGADFSTYQKVIAVNQHSVFLGMRAVVESMKKAGGGSIINISSLAGMVGAYKKVAYTASKFAVRGMNKDAALELGDYNIRVNSVHPGFIVTDMTRDLVSPELEQTLPIRRAGKIEEVTHLVTYLASDQSSYSSGSEFVVDGGLGAQ